MAVTSTLVQDFAAEKLTVDPGGTLPLHQLWPLWEAWTAGRGLQPGHLVDLVRELGRLSVARPVDPVTGSFVLVGARFLVGGVL